MDDIDFVPAPDDVFARLDTALIEEGLVSFMSDDEREALRAGHLRWVLEGFDELGLGKITLITSGGEVVSTVEVHWSVIVAGR